MGSGMSPGVILGSFRLVRPTGFGGFAQVWLAEDANGSRVALKVLAPAQGGPTALHRAWFRREFEVGQSVRSGYVATPFMAELESDPMWMALPFVEGQTLRQVLDAGPLDGGSVKRIASQTARGLADIHAHGLVHRDIKPSNIMISPGDGVTILDLGVVHDPEWTALTGLVQPGTMGYLAPESSGPLATWAVDVWAFSVVLIQMLNPGSRIGDPLDVSMECVDPGWAALVRACQALDPSSRPSAEAIVGWIDGLGTRVSAPSGAGLPPAPPGTRGAAASMAGQARGLPVVDYSGVNSDDRTPGGDAVAIPGGRGSEAGSTAKGQGPSAGDVPSRGGWVLAAGLAGLVTVSAALVLAAGVRPWAEGPATPPGSIATDAGEPSTQAPTPRPGTNAPPTVTQWPSRPSLSPSATPSPIPTPAPTEPSASTPTSAPTPSPTQPSTSPQPSTPPPPPTELPAPTPATVVPGAGAP